MDFNAVDEGAQRDGNMRPDYFNDAHVSNFRTEVQQGQTFR
jgi:hypothetical protein